MAGLTTVSLAVVVVGGILMASYVPGRPPLGLPTALACIGTTLVPVSVVLQSRLTDLAWGRFRGVPAGAAGLRHLGRDDLIRVRPRPHPGAPVALVMLMLVIFAADVPLIIAFTVARYSSPPTRRADARVYR